jgi:hypothetical protein
MDRPERSELGNGKAPVVNSDERLQSILENLEQCEAGLRAIGRGDTAHLVSLAVLELRMRLNGISDEELKALCEEMTPESDRSAEQADDAKSSVTQRRRPLLRVVK